MQRRLIGAIKELEGITFRNMYDIYPDFHIDVKREQDLLVRHDLIIWQHPLYWYSSPSLLKEWIDLVLEHGFAFGRKGRALEGKQVMSVVTTGGREETYMEKGANRYSLKQLLAPFEQTVTLCRMQYLPPFVVHGTHLIDEPGIIRAAEAYRQVLTILRDGAYDPEKILSSNYINDLTDPQTT